MSGEKIGQSPALKRSRPGALMDFSSAMAAVANGAQITKVEWNNKDEYGMLKDGFLMLHRHGAWHRWLVSDGDLLGQDWYVI